MAVNLCSTKAKFLIPNNALYSLTLFCNKWHNCVFTKRKKELVIKTIHSAKYVITFSPCSAARCIALYYQIDRSSVISTFTISQQQTEI